MTLLSRRKKVLLYPTSLSGGSTVLALTYFPAMAEMLKNSISMDLMPLKLPKKAVHKCLKCVVAAEICKVPNVEKI